MFVDDAGEQQTVNGHQVLTFDEFLASEASEKFVAIAIADSQVRETLAARCRDGGVSPFTVQSSDAVVMDRVKIGEGALISPFVTFGSNVSVGVHFHANLYSYVEHDCSIGDFVTFAPGAKCNGNVAISDHAYIGAGALLRQGEPGRPLRIGRGATVGMGAVVLDDVADGVTVVGNPARPIEKR